MYVEGTDMALISPGVEVTVIDESNYTATQSGTVAAIVIATAGNKTSGTGTGLASGTIPANAGTTYLIGSQRELTSTFGNPKFYNTASGTPINGYELNEYGLMAAYSMLGVTNRMYVTRANIDLNELVSNSNRPVGSPTNGTTWWDVSADTRWGIFEWNQSTGAFTNKSPIVIVSTTDLSGGVPKTSIGAIGSYAIVATNTSNPVYYKNRSNTWVLVGSGSWQESHPATSGTIANATYVNGNTIDINTTTVTLTGTTVSNLKDSINNAAIAGVSADVVDGKLEIYADDTAASDGSIVDGKITLANNSGSILTAGGITAGTYARPMVAQSPHYTVPAWKATDTVSRPSGSIWVKTTSSNLGFLSDVSVYSSATGTFASQTVNAYASDQSALKALDPVNGGSGIVAGTNYVQYDVTEQSRLTYKLFARYSAGALHVTGTLTTPTLTPSETFTISASAANSDALSAPVTVVLSGATLTTLASDINAAGVTNVSAAVASSGALVISHALGGVIVLKDTSGTPIADAGLSTLVASGQVRSGNASDLVLSNWVAATYTASTSAPSANPTDLTHWYSGGLEADIMIHDGSAWRGYKNITDTRGYVLSDTDPVGPIFSTTAPTVQSDLTALVNGDLWIDTSDLDNYPMLYRREVVSGEAKWVLIDKTDTSTENGILFADARFIGDTITDVVTGTIPTIVTLQSSDVLDIDTPSAAVYPRGMLLFNTRRSTYGVKEFRSDYFSRTNFSDVSVYPTLPTERDAWVTVSGSTFGRKAVRSVVVNAMKAALDTNTSLREDARSYNLLAAPGYPELIANMVSLNNDRRNTAFIVGDTPLRLAATSSAVETWATNTNGAADNGENGLVTSDPYLAVFYPAASTSDISGNTIVVPASHAMLRTIARSDDQSFQWFAPAGTRRGLVDNVSSIGYVNSVTGIFVQDNVRESLRDTLYSNRINPISFFNGSGILNYGNKTRATSPSALDRINVARLTGYLRGQLQQIATSYVFEPNDKITRDELKQQVEQTLNDLVAKRGIYDYLVVCDETNNTNDRIDRNELYVDVAIEPTKASEFIFIPIRLKNTGEIANGNIAAASTV